MSAASTSMHAQRLLTRAQVNADPVKPVHEALKVEKGLLEDLQRLCATASNCDDIQAHFAQGDAPRQGHG
ncbi:hypothetical protein VTI74DRAFT_866 [Chaetomium olivicolor]